MLILRRVGARPFVQIFDLGIKGQAPTLQDNSLYQRIIQTQPLNFRAYEHHFIRPNLENLFVYLIF